MINYSTIAHHPVLQNLRVDSLIKASILAHDFLIHTCYHLAEMITHVSKPRGVTIWNYE